jgi:hypothetical protein
MRFCYDIKIKIVKHRIEPFDNTWTGLTYIKNGVYKENGYVLLKNALSTQQVNFLLSSAASFGNSTVPGPYRFIII